MTEDDFLRTLVWSTGPGPLVGSRAVYLDGVVNGEPISSRYLASEEELSSRFLPPQHFWIVLAWLQLNLVRVAKEKML